MEKVCAGLPVTSVNTPATVELSVPPLRKQPAVSLFDLACDGLAQEVAELVTEFRERPLAILVEDRLPPWRNGQASPLDRVQVASGEALHTAEDRAWRGNHVKVQVVEYRLRVHRGVIPRDDIGTIVKHQRIAVHAKAEGADRETVHSEKRAARPIAQANSKRPMHFTRCRDAMALESGEPCGGMTVTSREIGEFRVDESGLGEYPCGSGTSKSKGDVHVHDLQIAARARRARRTIGITPVLRPARDGSGTACGLAVAP